MSSPAEATTASWRAASEARDRDLAITCLAGDVQIISPLTARFRFRGRDQAADMLSAAFEVINSIRYHTEVGDESTRALFYHSRCGREEFEEAQLPHRSTQAAQPHGAASIPAILTRLSPAHREGSLLVRPETVPSPIYTVRRLLRPGATGVPGAPACAQVVIRAKMVR